MSLKHFHVTIHTSRSFGMVLNVVSENQKLRNFGDIRFSADEVDKAEPFQCDIALPRYEQLSQNFIVRIGQYELRN